MAGADTSDALVAALLGGVFHVLDGHGFLPVDPVPVFEKHPDGAAQGVSVANAGLDMGVVALDLLAATATVTTLAAGQVLSDVFLVERQIGRDAFDDNHEALPVGLARRKPSYHRASAS